MSDPILLLIPLGIIVGMIGGFYIGYSYRTEKFIKDGRSLKQMFVDEFEQEPQILDRVLGVYAEYVLILIGAIVK